MVGPGLAHADGMPGRGPLHLAARRRRRPAPSRCCATPRAYARIRKQFDLPIGKMEGLEEPLARMVENAYVNEAARGVTASMVSRGEKPSVISAHHEVPDRPSACAGSLNDAMDLHGGRGICDGPSNYLQARLPDDAGRPSRWKAPTSSRARSSPSPRARCARTPTSTRRSRPARMPTTERGLAAFERRSATRRLHALEPVRRFLPQRHARRLVRPRAGEGLRHGRMVPPAVALKKYT